MNEIRNLATIEVIKDIKPIENADSIMRARVRGWDVVIRKGEYQIGDLCVYFEVDSFLDVSNPVFAFLAPQGVKVKVETIDGVDVETKGHALKTARFRGQISQGLVIKPESFEILGEVDASRVGENVTDVLKVTKWDIPIPDALKGSIKGYLPSWFSASSEVRVQNTAEILKHETSWVATEKIDGTSTSFYVDGTDIGACTRNVDLLDDGNNVWGKGKELDIWEKIKSSKLGDKVVVQGELFGPGSGKKNVLDVKTLQYKVFAIWTLENGAKKEISRADWPLWAKEMSVPTHSLPFPKTMEEALTQVENLKSKINSSRNVEGVVWRSETETFFLEDGKYYRASFKVISNKYLLKNDR